MSDDDLRDEDPHKVPCRVATTTTVLSSFLLEAAVKMLVALCHLLATLFSLELSLIPFLASPVVRREYQQWALRWSTQGWTLTLMYYGFPWYREAVQRTRLLWCWRKISLCMNSSRSIVVSPSTADPAQVPRRWWCGWWLLFRRDHFRDVLLAVSLAMCGIGLALSVSQWAVSRLHQWTFEESPSTRSRLMDIAFFAVSAAQGLAVVLTWLLVCLWSRGSRLLRRAADCCCSGGKVKGLLYRCVHLRASGATTSRAPAQPQPQQRRPFAGCPGGWWSNKRRRRLFFATLFLFAVTVCTVVLVAEQQAEETAASAGGRNRKSHRNYPLHWSQASVLEEEEEDYIRRRGDSLLVPGHHHDDNDGCTEQGLTMVPAVKQAREWSEYIPTWLFSCYAGCRVCSRGPRVPLWRALLFRQCPASPPLLGSPSGDDNDENLPSPLLFHASSNVEKGEPFQLSHYNSRSRTISIVRQCPALTPSSSSSSTPTVEFANFAHSELRADTRPQFSDNVVETSEFRRIQQWWRRDLDVLQRAQQEALKRSRYPVSNTTTTTAAAAAPLLSEGDGDGRDPTRGSSKKSDEAKPIMSFWHPHQVLEHPLFLTEALEVELIPGQSHVGRLLVNLQRSDLFLYERSGSSIKAPLAARSLSQWSFYVLPVLSEMITIRCGDISETHVLPVPFPKLPPSTTTTSPPRVGGRLSSSGMSSSSQQQQPQPPPPLPSPEAPPIPMEPANVLLVILDAVSRPEAHRSLPRTVAALRRLRTKLQDTHVVIEMTGLTTLGHSTNPNIGALFVGAPLSLVHVPFHHARQWLYKRFKVARSEALLEHLLSMRSKKGEDQVSQPENLSPQQQQQRQPPPQSKSRTTWITGSCDHFSSILFRDLLEDPSQVPDDIAFIPPSPPTPTMNHSSPQSSSLYHAESTFTNFWFGGRRGPTNERRWIESLLHSYLSSPSVWQAPDRQSLIEKQLLSEWSAAEGRSALDRDTFIPFCDGEYGASQGIFQGPSSILPRCLGGRHVHEQVLRYSQAALREDLEDQVPFLHTVYLMEGHEGSRHVVKGLDGSLASFVKGLSRTSEERSTTIRRSRLTATSFSPPPPPPLSRTSRNDVDDENNNEGDLNNNNETFYLFDNPSNILFLTSDHGSHMGPLFEWTTQGAVERSLPLGIWVISKAYLAEMDRRARRPRGASERAFRDRARLTSTHADTFRTLLELLQLEQLPIAAVRIPVNASSLLRPLRKAKHEERARHEEMEKRGDEGNMMDNHGDDGGASRMAFQRCSDIAAHPFRCFLDYCEKKPNE